MDYNYRIVQKTRAVESNLQTVVHLFDYHYLAQKLKYCCIILNRESLLAVKHDVYLIDEILQYLNENNFEEVPAIVLYHRLFYLLKEEENENHYQQLKKGLEQHSEALPKTELREIYVATFNYCNKKLKGGNAIYLREIFELFKQAIEKEIFVVDGFIVPHQFFRNVVMAALRLNELSWAEEFIKQYQAKILEQHRSNLANYCLAALCFYRKEYEKTLSYLLEFEFQDAYNYVEHKTLLVKTYYELGAWDALDSTLAAFTRYLNRNKVIPEHFKVSYKNFIRLLTKLYQWRMQSKQINTELLTAIKSQEKVSDKEWLLEKVANS